MTLVIRNHLRSVAETLQQSAKEMKLHPSQVIALLDHLDFLELKNQALDEAIAYAEHRGSRFDFDTWTKMCKSAREDGRSMPFALNNEIAAHAATLNALRAVQTQLRELELDTKAGNPRPQEFTPESIFGRLHAERFRQEQKHPGDTIAAPDKSEEEKLSILSEEFGEVSKEVNELRSAVKRQDADAAASIRRKLEQELVQVGACCVGWLEAIYANRRTGNA